MICPSCQHEPPEGSQFCNRCGAVLELHCPSCNTSVPPGSRFCNSCGHVLDPAATAPPERALDRALELVEETNGRSIEPQLLEERARLAGLLGDAAACERGLRNAQRLYIEIGAGGHAERLVEELGP